MLDPTAEPEFIISDRSKHYRSQNYRHEWEEVAELRAWLTKGKNDKRAHCTFCDIEMTADLCVIKSHAKGARHRKRLQGGVNTRPFKSAYNPKWEKEPDYRDWIKPGRLPSKAECLLCDVELSAEKTVLRNHGKSLRHARAVGHASRVREITKVWVTEKKYMERMRRAGEETYCLEERATDLTSLSSDGNIVDKLTKYILKGFKRLPSSCRICRTPLLLPPSGGRLCVVCNSDTAEAEQDDAAVCSVSVQVSEDAENSSAATVYIKEEEKDDTDASDGPLVYLELRPADQHNITEEDSIVIHGVQFTPAIRALVRALLHKMAELNTSIGGGGAEAAVALCRLERVVALLSSIKRL